LLTRPLFVTGSFCNYPSPSFQVVSDLAILFLPFWLSWSCVVCFSRTFFPYFFFFFLPYSKSWFLLYSHPLPCGASSFFSPPSLSLFPPGRVPLYPTRSKRSFLQHFPPPFFLVFRPSRWIWTSSRFPFCASFFLVRDLSGPPEHGLLPLVFLSQPPPPRLWDVSLVLFWLFFFCCPEHESPSGTFSGMFPLEFFLPCAWLRWPTNNDSFPLSTLLSPFRWELERRLNSPRLFFRSCFPPIAGWFFFLGRTGETFLRNSSLLPTISFL